MLAQAQAAQDGGGALLKEAPGPAGVPSVQGVGDGDSRLPLTACLVFRLGAMPLRHRALHRATGTIAGILPAPGLAALAPHGWTLIALAMTVGALVPALTDWSYTGHTAMAMAMATVIVLILANPTAIGDTREITARLVDTLLACLIALLLGHLVWPPHLPHPFLARRRA
ncbi:MULTISPECIES: FUSC family protein [Streptomyces]|uniref:Integral membrane bound transporter domain-containing protein n=2 Tax=Streptomyces TaxID=1883 RepID=A0A2N8PII2_STRNR|nr:MULTISPECIES: FUSC family protein [Streptomyces]PNE40864.1 hypothetical protein AOB60_08765 [Streptomyces noursei]SHM47894.1 Fusaric acid resistance protein-like [Streptomyces yunnanensis]